MAASVTVSLRKIGRGRNPDGVRGKIAMERSVATVGVIASALILLFIVGARFPLGAIVVAMILVLILGARFAGWGRGMWPPHGPFD